MRPLLLNSYDALGGAARSAYRLLQGLRSIGVDARLLVQERARDDAAVLTARRSRLGAGLASLRPVVDAQPLQARHPRRRRVPFSLNWLFERQAARIRSKAPDLVNLHWINAGFLRIETLPRISPPVVWTLHDMWPFTGGCHYDEGCGKHQHACGACPLLGSRKAHDLSRRVWRRKQRAWRDFAPVIVAPSVWLAKEAGRSSLFRDRQIEVIPNGIDTEAFRPVPSATARELLGLPKDAKLVLFGGVHPLSDPRKGFLHFREALSKLAAAGEAQRVEVLLLGVSRESVADEADLAIDLPIHFLGHLNDDVSLALAYSAADLFAAPSLQENLPNTVLEAMSCGTPCVAFDVGGMSDLIDHKSDGFLCNRGEAGGLAEGIARLLSQEDREALSQRARAKVEREFSLELQARRYRALFDSMLDREPERREGRL